MKKHYSIILQVLPETPRNLLRARWLPQVTYSTVSVCGGGEKFLLSLPFPIFDLVHMHHTYFIIAQKYEFYSTLTHWAGRQFFFRFSDRLRSECISKLSLQRLSENFTWHLHMSILGGFFCRLFLEYFGLSLILKRFNIVQEEIKWCVMACS